MKKKILIVMGTRPEAIKLAPLFIELKQQPQFELKVCNTGQHHTMLNQVLEFFRISPDFSLGLMKENQTLYTLTAALLNGFDKVFSEYRPDLVVVQGDTTTAFIGALSAYYGRIKVAHVEAGLRSGNRYSPFPEEVNRQAVGVLADFHFCPTPKAIQNLKDENCRGEIHLVGNTVIDALLKTRDLIRDQPGIGKPFHYLGEDKMILITGHRRESFGEPFKDICRALQALARQHRNIHFVYPVHLNPNVRKPVYDLLGNEPNIHLVEPVNYPLMTWLMDRSHLILTDSGGVQEEAPTLGKPVLVMREVTERTEGIEAGTALLVGTETDAIVENVNLLLSDQNKYDAMAAARNPYGDGTASKQIVSILKEKI